MKRYLYLLKGEPLFLVTAVSVIDADQKMSEIKENPMKYTVCPGVNKTNIKYINTIVNNKSVKSIK